MKKLISILLVLVLMVGLMPAVALAADGSCGAGVTWSVDRKGVLTISGTGAMDNYANISAAPYAYEYITSVVVEEGITAIGQNAFAGMTLDSVKLPESLANIGANAFKGATIAAVSFDGHIKQWEKDLIVAGGNDAIYNNVTINKALIYDDGEVRLENYVVTSKRAALPSEFMREYNDYIHEVIFLPGVTAVEYSSCYGLTELRKVTLPNGIIFISSGAFYGCEKLESINLPEGITDIYGQAFYGCKSLKELKIPESVKNIYAMAFGDCTSLEKINLPAKLEMLGEYAFQNTSSLKSITLPNTLTKLEHTTFKGSGLESIVIPEGITEMGDWVFMDCKNLKSVSLPSTLTAISGNAFAYSGLEKMTIPSNIISVGYGAFSYSQLRELIIEEGVEKINSSAFEGCVNLESVVVPGSVKYLGDKAFGETPALESAVLWGGTENINDSTFYRTYYSAESLEKVIIHEGVKKIVSCAFLGASIKELHLPGSLESIGQSAFAEPRWIDGQYRDVLEVIYYDGTEAQWAKVDKTGLKIVDNSIVRFARDAGTTGDCRWVLQADGLLKIVGIGSMADYAYGEAPWYKYRDEITRVIVEPYVDRVGSYAFADLCNLTVVEGAEGVNSIGDGAYKDCVGLSKLTLGENVIGMGKNIFAGCTGLVSVGGVGSGACIELAWKDTIPANAFYGADNLESVAIPQNITRIMNFAFAGCDKLSEITIPDNVITLGSRVFENSKNLETVTVGSNVENIEGNMFYGCSALEEVNVSAANPAYMSQDGIVYSKDVTTLVFAPCTLDDGFVVPGSVATIAEDALCDTQKLTCMTMDATVQTIGAGAFYGSAIRQITYTGTDYQWTLIDIGEDNEPLKNVSVICEHHYLEPEWVWEENNAGAKAVFNCIMGDGSEEVAAGIIHYERIESTCAEEGKEVYRTSVNFRGKEYATETYTGLPLQQHDISHAPAIENKVDASCTQPDSYDEVLYCAVCSAEVKRVNIVGTVKGHAYVATTTAPTCEADGFTKRVCSACGDEYTDEIVAAKGHVYKNYITEATCTEDGFTTHECCYCDYTYVDSQVPAKGHSFGQWVTITAATDSKEGLEERSCPCGEKESRTIPMQGHTHKLTAVAEVAATCTEAGTGAYYKCSCGRIFADAAGKTEIAAPAVIPAKGHSFGRWVTITAATDSKEGLEERTCACGVKESRAIPVLGHTHKLTAVAEVAATCTEVGTGAYYKCSCGRIFADADGKTEIAAPAVIPRKNHSFGQWTKLNESTESRSCASCGHAETREIVPVENPFTDVKTEDYYFEPVQWAVALGVTNGMSADSFAPSTGCTRGQIVTFLWRSVGKPVPQSTENPFTDVSEDSYYYEAVLWAVENGITTGLSATTFGPNAVCTRAQVATFLYRASDNQIVAATSFPFEDVSENDYFAVPVLWAVERGVTNGIAPGSFGPSQTCTRGQIVTFLYRAVAD